MADLVCELAPTLSTETCFSFLPPLQRKVLDPVFPRPSRNGHATSLVTVSTTILCLYSIRIPD